MSWIDAGALLLIVGLGIGGALKGAIRFVVGLAAVTLGIFLAGRYGDQLGAEGWPLIREADDPARVGLLTGCILLFVGALLAGAFVSRLLRKAAEDTDLAGLDRALGFVFGALRGALYVAVVVVVLAALDPAVLREDLQASRALRYTRDLADWSRPHAPDTLVEWLDDALGPGGDADPAGDGG